MRLKTPGLGRRRIASRLIHRLPRSAVALLREWAKVPIRPRLRLPRLRLETSRLRLRLIPARLLNAAIGQAASALSLSLHSGIAVGVSAKAVPSGACLRAALGLRIAAGCYTRTGLRVHLRLSVATRSDARTTCFILRHARILAECGTVTRTRCTFAAVC